MKMQHQTALTLLGVLALAGCATAPSSAQLDKMAADVVKSSFFDKGIVKVTALDPEDINSACTAADVAGRPLDQHNAIALQEEQRKEIIWPTDGKFIGDWKVGEKLAQSGRGLTWTDNADTPNGANCYNCHQLDPKEISYGTIGPSLAGYAKTRGIIADPSSAASKAIIEYTWGKIWNAKAYNACSVMPRVGHKGIMTEAQVRDLVALLLDPKSPVNQ